MAIKQHLEKIEHWLSGWRGIAIITATVALIGIVGLLWWLNRGDWVYPEQINRQISTPIKIGQSFGQTFVASQDGLQAIDIMLGAKQGIEKPLVLHFELYSSPESKQILRQADVTVSNLQGQQWVRIPFEPLEKSRLKYYYARIVIDTNLTENIFVMTSVADSYIDGSFYFEGVPQNLQATFRLNYERKVMFAGYIQDFMTILPKILVGLLVFVLPGWALLTFVNLPIKSWWIEKVAVAVGSSVALYPVIFLLAWLFHIKLNTWVFSALIGISAIVIMAKYRIWRKRFWQQVKDCLNNVTISESITNGTVLLLLALIGISRASAIRHLMMPLWDDSIQHVIIAQRIIENNGLFQSWLPYAPYQTFSLHFGFHVNMAILAWLLGISASTAVLWGGQLFNFFAVLTLVALASRWAGKWGGIISLLVAGVISQFPGYYINWGRYPQLAGQVILPIAAWWLWQILQVQQLTRQGMLRLILVVATVCIGMILSYYRMAFHLVAFVVVLLVGLVYATKGSKRIDIKKILFTLVLIGITIIVLLSPWGRILISRAQIEPVVTGNYLLQNAGIVQQLQHQTFIFTQLQILGILVGLVGILFIPEVQLYPLIWLITLVALPALKTLPLPGVGIIQEFTIATSLYIPFALMWGGVVGGILNLLKDRDLLKTFLGGLVVFGMAIFFFRSQSEIVDRKFDLIGYPDVAASNWVSQHLPPDANILINGIIYTDGTSVVGGDGGWWLPFLAERSVVIPPQYALVVETPIVSSYSDEVNKLVHSLRESSVTSDKGKRALCDFPKPIDYVYVGQRRGMVAGVLPNPPKIAMLNPTDLQNDESFTLLYQRDFVQIFSIDPTICK